MLESQVFGRSIKTKINDLQFLITFLWLQALYLFMVKKKKNMEQKEPKQENKIVKNVTAQHSLVLILNGQASFPVPCMSSLLHFSQAGLSSPRCKYCLYFNDPQINYLLSLTHSLQEHLASLLECPVSTSNVTLAEIELLTLAPSHCPSQ